MHFTIAIGTIMQIKRQTLSNSGHQGSHVFSHAALFIQSLASLIVAAAARLLPAARPVRSWWDPLLFNVKVAAQPTGVRGGLLGPLRAKRRETLILFSLFVSLSST